MQSRRARWGGGCLWIYPSSTTEAVTTACDSDLRSDGGGADASSLSGWAGALMSGSKVSLVENARKTSILPIEKSAEVA